MSPVLEVLRGKLKTRLTTNSKWCVALSGGLDSTVLLHGMCAMRREFNGVAVRAVHVNHGLHPMAGNWAAHCESMCRELDLPLRIETVTVEAGDGDGIEAAARRVRYAAFERALGRDEYLLTAHHQDDQLETVLLRVLRGAGTDGLAGIADLSRFGSGWLVRPMLRLSRRDILGYAESAGLRWIDDPTNLDTTLDRNYLRHEVVPVLRERWPGMGKTISRAGRLSAEASGLLDMLAEGDCRGLVHEDALDLAGLRRLAPERQRNVIRHVLKLRGLPMPSETQLKTGLEQLMSARPDGRPILRWGNAQIQRYRNRLYFLDFHPEAESASLPAQYAWDGSDAIDMGPVRGSLRMVEARSGGLATAMAAHGIVVRFRHGGERIRRVNQRHHQLLKKLFQERGIVPWMRGHVPLLYGHDGGRDRLLAVGDLWIAAEAAARPSESGYRILWENHPVTQ